MGYSYSDWLDEYYHPYHDGRDEKVQNERQRKLQSDRKNGYLVEVYGYHFNLNESAFNKFNKYAKFGFIIVSACRNSVLPDKMSVSAMMKDKYYAYYLSKYVAQTQDLKTKINNMGFKYIPTLGYTKEESKQKEVVELSLMIPYDPNNKYHLGWMAFISWGIDLVRPYNQDSIFVKMPLFNKGKACFVDAHPYQRTSIGNVKHTILKDKDGNVITDPRYVYHDNKVKDVPVQTPVENKNYRNTEVSFNLVRKTIPETDVYSTKEIPHGLWTRLTGKSITTVDQNGNIHKTKLPRGRLSRDRGVTAAEGSDGAVDFDSRKVDSIKFESLQECFYGGEPYYKGYDDLKAGKDGEITNVDFYLAMINHISTRTLPRGTGWYNYSNHTIDKKVGIIRVIHESTFGEGNP